MEQENRECGKIFVAGTGRSGTTHLARLLGVHPQIYHVPVESRFIIDPGGLEDLVECLTKRYTFDHGDQAIKLFMMSYLNNRLGQEVYEALSEFASRLVAYEFQEPLPPGSDSPNQQSSQPKSFRRIVARYFKNRAELIALCRQCVDSAFSRVAKRNKKIFWCEKTPLNLLSMEFLWEMFPESSIIHIKRDPRGVLQSVMKQPWAPSDPHASIYSLIPIYERWKELKDRLDLSNKKYMEIKIEEMLENPPERMSRIIEFIGADTNARYPEDCFVKEKVEYWRQECDPEIIKLCEEQLGDYFDLMGYCI
ncbi:MAG: sulfotransferase [bacterium]